MTTQKCCTGCNNQEGKKKQQPQNALLQECLLMWKRWCLGHVVCEQSSRTHCLDAKIPTILVSLSILKPTWPTEVIYTIRGCQNTTLLLSMCILRPTWPMRSIYQYFCHFCSLCLSLGWPDLWIVLSVKCQSIQPFGEYRPRELTPSAVSTIPTGRESWEPCQPSIPSYVKRI